MKNPILKIDGSNVEVNYVGDRISSVIEQTETGSVCRAYLDDFLFGFVYSEDLFEEVLPTLERVLSGYLSDEVISNDQMHALVTKDRTYFFYEYDALKLKSNSTLLNSVDTYFFTSLLRQLQAYLAT